MTTYLFSLLYKLELVGFTPSVSTNPTNPKNQSYKILKNLTNPNSN